MQIKYDAYARAMNFIKPVKRTYENGFRKKNTCEILFAI